MGKSKKSGKQDHALQAIVLLTAIMNLVKALIELISELTQ